MTGLEQYQCCACFHIGPLNLHGGCERCSSQIVISQELMLCTKTAASSVCSAAGGTE
jgi:hypothetical protein